MRSVTKTVQRRRCTRSASAHARSRASIGVETRLLARHRLAPPKQAGREQKRVENGERCTVVMSLPAPPPPYESSPISLELNSGDSKGKFFESRRFTLYLLFVIIFTRPFKRRLVNSSTRRPDIPCSFGLNGEFAAFDANVRKNKRTFFQIFSRPGRSEIRPDWFFHHRRDLSSPRLCLYVLLSVFLSVFLKSLRAHQLSPSSVSLRHTLTTTDRVGIASCFSSLLRCAL